MLDTGLDNELFTLDTGLGDSTMAAEEQEAGTYWVITSRAKGGASSPFGGTAESNQTSQLVQMTEQQLRQEYQDSGQLQQQFGSFDNYMSYINDSQEWVQSAEWMLATPEYRPGSKEWAYINQEDIGWRPGEREEIEQKIRNDMMMARTSAYYQWMGGEEGQALMQKYGIQDTIYNDDGDQFRWTGSGYQKTIKVDDHASFADYVKVALQSAVMSALSYAAVTAIGGALSGTAVGDAIGKGANAVREALGKALSAVPGISPTNASTIAEFFFPITKPGLGGQSDPWGLLSGLSGSAGAVGGAQSGYENVVNAVNEAMSSNVIVNFTGEPDNDGDTNQGDSWFQGKDGTYTITNANNLPPGYIVNVYGNIIHEATGTVVYDGDIRKELFPIKGYGANFITFEPYKDGDDNGGGGGNTGSTDGSTSGGAPMSQAEANAAIQELLESGLVGQDFFDAAYEAGITMDQLGEAMNEGILPRGAIVGPRDDNTGSTEGRPNLVLYDGNPNLLDENGAWVAGGTFFDRTDPENPRKYYVWVNKNTGEEYKIYDDELGTYDGGVKDFEAYLKDELPDITEDELILARRLIEMGDPVGQVIADIIAGRKDLNDSNTDTVTLPSGETVEVPTTDNRKEGDPCSIGDKYNGTVVVAPSGQLVCKIDFGDSDNTVDNDGNPDATPDGVPKEGDPCPLPGGAGEGVIKDGVCQPRTGTTSTAIVPSLVCESGWSDSAGICIPVDDPRISGTNTPAPGQCPVGYSKNRRGECIPNTQGDMGGESEGDGENGNIPNDGDPCEVDGKQGTYQDGVCVISTNTVNPGVIDLTGGSEWGDSGDGGGDNGGQGPGEGPGSGPGEGGNGGSNGPGLGDVGARKGSSNPVWSPIPPGYKFRRFVKRQGIGANAPMIQQPTFQNPDFTGMRAGLLSSMMNQVKKT